MATSFSAIYERALSKMREYAFLDMSDAEVYEVLSPFLQSAHADFTRICEDNLEETEGNGYSSNLSNESIEILALGVVSYWMGAYVRDAEKFQNALGTKDYSVFSPANLLNSVKNAYDSVQLEYQSKINLYSYIHGKVTRAGKGE